MCSQHLLLAFLFTGLMAGLHGLVQAQPLTIAPIQVTESQLTNLERNNPRCWFRTIIGINGNQTQVIHCMTVSEVRNGPSSR